MYTDGLNHFTRINGNTLSHISSQAGQPISSDEIHILVVWQGKLAKENVSHQPKLYVLIQQIEIDSNVFSLLNQYFLIKVPSSKPHEFSIGSIFRVNSKTFIKVGITVKEKKHFQFKNANKLSQYISPLELNKCDFILNAFKNISPLNKSRLIYENLIKIKCKNNKTIYIPAMLFFTSYYGSSNEIHRLLLTRPYSYIEAFISKKIFSPQELVYPGIHFKCDKKFTELDAVFMNAMFWTKRNKESVAETIQTIQKHDPKKPLELKPNVYFNDFTYIAAYSFQIGKNEYLISEIDKSSMPSTDKDTVTVSTAIEAIKTNKKNDGEKNLPHGFRPNDNSELEKKPLDSEAVAGHDSPKIVKHSAKTQYICHVNNIKNTKPIELYDSTSASLNKPDIESLATGERYGTNKKTGRLIEHFGKLLDTHKQKTIDDIYKACLYLQNNSNLINCVSVYNAGKKEFIETPEKLTLVAFDLLIESEEPDYINSSLINNWVNISKDNNRGCCILRIENDNISFYLLEIERKMKMDGVSERGSYKLFSFQLKDEDCFEECLSQILKEIVKSKGRTSVLPSNCTLNSKGHPHTHSKYDDITYLNLIKNIIKHHS